MAEVLVLVDHTDGRLRKATAELLTIARRLGEPSAVHIGVGAEKAQVTLANLQAELKRLQTRARPGQIVGQRLKKKSITKIFPFKSSSVTFLPSWLVN